MQFSLKCETMTVCNLDEPRRINILWPATPCTRRGKTIKDRPLGTSIYLRQWQK